MKKVSISVVLLAMMAFASVSCQKESETMHQVTDSETFTVRAVSYAVDGVTQIVILHGDNAWEDFMLRMMALAEEGHVVRVFSGNSASRTMAAKERIEYKTKDKKAAAEWTLQKINEGYDVEVTYNSQTGEYTCVATK